jgi:hypothetical protein
MSEAALVYTGNKIEVELIDTHGDRERLAVQIVPDAFADLARGYLGEGTPLCQAIYGQPVGAEIDYAMGDVLKVRLLAVTPTDEGPDKGVAVRREATLRKAVDQSDRTNAILFASSFNGKWGDYDPAGLVEEDEKDEDSSTAGHRAPG